MKINGLILAAGQGTRMKSSKPKVLFDVIEKPMIQCVGESLKKAGVTNIIPIVHSQRMEVLRFVDYSDYVIQDKTLGTGHAVMQAKDLLAGEEGLTLVLAGDQPLISSKSLKSLINYHIKHNCDMTLMTAKLENPFGYGRVIKKNQQVVKIVEQKDLSKEEENVDEVNISTFCFNNKRLFELIDELKNENNSNEYYITDLVEIFNKHELVIGAIPIDDNNDSIGVNDLETLAYVNKLVREKVNQKWMQRGVYIVDPENTLIGVDVEIGCGTIIYPNTTILGKSKIGEDVTIRSSHIENSTIGDRTTIGPFAHVRLNSNVGSDCRIGNFVELKKVVMGNNSKCAHLAYLGDATIGNNVNVGCGVITVNYDGKNKYHTVIEDDAFIGSNVNLIAPLKVGKNSKIAAGTTLTQDTCEYDLAIGRVRETIKQGYYKEKK